MKGQGGFTLLELMVVIAILGLALTGASFALDAGGGARLRASAGDVSRGLAEIRNEAMREGRAVAVTFDPASSDASADRTLPALPPGVELRFQAGPPPLVGEASDRLWFFPDGSSTGGEVTLRRRSARILLRVDPLSGRVTVDG